MKLKTYATLCKAADFFATVQGEHYEEDYNDHTDNDSRA